MNDSLLKGFENWKRKTDNTFYKVIEIKYYYIVSVIIKWLDITLNEEHQLDEDSKKDWRNE